MCEHGINDFAIAVWNKQKREWNRNKIFQNLFRCTTPARLTRIKKACYKCIFNSVNYCQYIKKA
ncbi:hypothetical protein BUZ39_03885 [Staphylococcus haemolyticus]|nr:hypothetical protein BUZ39_03885 [Staphylococcus haemolyticus]